MARTPKGEEFLNKARELLSKAKRVVAQNDFLS